MKAALLGLLLVGCSATLAGTPDPGPSCEDAVLTMRASEDELGRLGARFERAGWPERRVLLAAGQAVLALRASALDYLNANGCAEA